MTNNPSVSVQPVEKPDKEPLPLASPSSFKCSPTNLVFSCSLKRKRQPKIEIPNVLQEIQANTLKVKDVAPQEDAVCFSGLGVGVFSVKGKKKFIEDTNKIVSSLHKNSNKVIFVNGLFLFLFFIVKFSTFWLLPWASMTKIWVFFLLLYFWFVGIFWRLWWWTRREEGCWVCCRKLAQQCFREVEKL